MHITYQVKQACLNCNKTYRLVQIAHWDSTAAERLRFYSNERPQFGIDPSGDVLFHPFESQCKECDQVSSNVWLCLLAVAPVILVLDPTTQTLPHQQNVKSVLTLCGVTIL